MYFGVEVEEFRVFLFTVGSEKQLRKYSPTQKVSVLLNAGTGIWEYISGRCLASRAWQKTFGESALLVDVLTITFWLSRCSC